MCSGGGGGRRPPKEPEAPVAPVVDLQERQGRRDRQRQAGATLLTSGQGVTSSGNAPQKTLLGS